MLKIFCASCLGLSKALSSQITLKMCAAAKIAKNLLKTFYFEGSRSFKVIDVDKSKKPTTSAPYDKQPVCA